jgi:Acetyltransferase (GNAT) family
MKGVEPAPVDDVELSFDTTRLDLDIVHRFLSSEAYRSLGIPGATVERAVAQSLCIGAYRGSRQIGFARLVTDRATFAYLADVFVLESERGRGIARRMIGALLGHDEVEGLRRVLLFTAGAHAVYRGLGFAPLARPERGMEIIRPDAYRNTAEAGRD